MRLRYEILVDVEIEDEEDNMSAEETSEVLQHLIEQSLDQPAVREVDVEVIEVEEI